MKKSATAAALVQALVTRAQSDMVNGKAKLMRENYCDGLGDCLPACPTGAISFEEREAPAYDEAAVIAAKKAAQETPKPCEAVQVAQAKSASPRSAEQHYRGGLSRKSACAMACSDKACSAHRTVFQRSKTPHCTLTVRLTRMQTFTMNSCAVM